MKLSLLLIGGLLAPAQVVAQGGWRLGVGLGPYRVDDLAGTPIVPSVRLGKATGTRTLIGGTLGLIRNAGFYRLNALTLDLDVGLRSRAATVEWIGSIGPTALLGGDGDGSPYAGVGGHLTTGLNWWVGRRIGVTATATGRLWFGTGNSRFSPGANVGLVLRL